MEGHWETQRGAPLILSGWPDMAREETRMAIQIPMLGSLILGHAWDAEIRGLRDFPPDQRPTNVPLVFWSFRVMVGLGLLMIALGLAALWLRRRGRLHDTRWFLRWAVAMGPSRADCGHRRVDRHGIGAPALHHLWAAADGGQRVAGRSTRGGGLPRRVRARLLPGLRRGHLVPVPPVLAAPAAA